MGIFFDHDPGNFREMPNIVVTGAANGLGLEFAKILSSKRRNNISAFDKNPIPDIDANVIKTHGDITSPLSLRDLTRHQMNGSVDLLIHSIGIRGLVPTIEASHPEDVARAETLDVMDGETIAQTFQINALATFSLIKTFLPNLHRSYIKSGGVPPKVIVMSSRMGSIGHNTSGGAYAYRASKAALNAMIRSFSIDVPYATFLMVHPGRVETGLTKCREEGAIEPKESVAAMMKLIDFIGPSHSGKFVDRFGVEIPW